MSNFLILVILIFASFHSTGGVMTCGDAMSVGEEARLALHQSAQKRAQDSIEEFMGKKIINPYSGHFVKERDATPSTMAYLIEVFWCETDKTPLHTAYYRYYSTNKSAFE